MKLIFGLGNPGKEYENTRHNVGFRILDYLAAKERVNYKNKPLYQYAILKDKAVLIKPLTYMNLTGKAVLEATKSFLPDDVLIIYDDIYLPIGTLRLRKKGSDGGHKGVRSVIESIDSDSFSRLKIGVGEKSIQECTPIEEDENLKSSQDSIVQKNLLPLSDYVLSEFTAEEEVIIDNIIHFSYLLLQHYINNGYNEMVNYYSKNKQTLSGNN